MTATPEDRSRWAVRLIAEAGRQAALTQAERDTEMRAKYGDKVVDDPFDGVA